MPKTNVVFVIEEDGGVCAVFPNEKATNFGHVVCYAHVGQHSNCDVEWYRSRPKANKGQYHDLFLELTKQGYDLEIDHA